MVQGINILIIMVNNTMQVHGINILINKILMYTGYI